MINFKSVRAMICVCGTCSRSANVVESCTKTQEGGEGMLLYTALWEKNLHYRRYLEIKIMKQTLFCSYFSFLGGAYIILFL